jgi:HAD superfamily hydrolase (TIGR01509 family)
MLKAAIFDVGGVLVRTYDQAGRRRWEARLGLAPGGLARLVFDSQVGRQAQLGQASSQDVWSWIGTEFRLSPDELNPLKRDFWAGDRVDQELCDAIRRLRTDYRTAMLSNSWARDGRAMAENFGFADCFDVFVTSAEVGVMKPAARIYHVALERLGVAPSQAIFVDDFIENVEAARQLGMRAVHFVDPVTARRQLEEEFTTPSPPAPPPAG